MVSKKKVQSIPDPKTKYEHDCFKGSFRADF
jgi:hypothetical protein